jgi:hypothetical protein
MQHWIIELFRKPSAEVLAQRELEDAQRNLLECQRMRDYYENMVNFNSVRIKQTRAMLRGCADKQ